ncbi:hypothetical protein OG21DRAFT_1491810 [Imleria badia]|nr:hypothetical protein OG21DRAFT_1491810 [Imleria badia]
MFNVQPSSQPSLSVGLPNRLVIVAYHPDCQATSTALNLILTLAVHRTQQCPQPPSGPNLPCHCCLPLRSPSQNFRAVLRNFKKPVIEKDRRGCQIPVVLSCPESTRITILGLTQTCTYDTVRFPLPVGALQSIARSYAEQKELSGQLDSKRHTQSLLGDHICTIKDPLEKQAVLGEAKTLKAEIMSLEEKTLSTHGPPVMPPSPERDHVTIGRALGLFEFEAAAIVTGSSWYYLLKEAALLENALTNYAISIALKHGF